MRGILDLGGSGLLWARITPAGAGKYVGPLTTALVVPESSPLVRGILGENHVPTWFVGITPAGAGNTKSGVYGVDHARNHPRWCGEYTKSIFPAAMSRESPPLVRGIPLAQYCAKGRQRITPAGAGNTLKNPYHTGIFKNLNYLFT